MPRGLTAAQIAAFTADGVQLAKMVDVYLDSGRLSMTTASSDLQYGGVTYQRGVLQSVSDIEHSITLGAPKYSIIFTGVDKSMIQKVLGETVVGRRVVVMTGAVADGVLAADPIVDIDAYIDDGVIAEDQDSGTSNVKISASSELAVFGRPGGRQTTTEIQQKYFPTDQFFDFAQVADQKVPWGRA